MAFPIGPLITAIPGIIKAIGGLVVKKKDGQEAWYPVDKVKAAGQWGLIVMGLLFLLEQAGAPVSQYPELQNVILYLVMFIAGWAKKDSPPVS